MTKTRSPLPLSRHAAAATLRAYLDGPPAVGQRELADAAGCNQSMISMLVRGKRVPSARLAVKLHAITGVPLKMLIDPRLTAPTTPPRQTAKAPAKAKKRGPPGARAPAGQHTSP